MKKNKFLLCLSPLFSIGVLFGCNKTKLPSIKNFEEKTPDVYMVLTKGAGAPSITKESKYSKNIPINLINNDSVAYYSIADGVLKYLNLLKDAAPKIYKGYNYDTNSKDVKSTITNLANNSTCVIDYNKQTMEFSDYSSFLNNDIDQVSPNDDIFTLARNYFCEIKKEKYVAPKSSLVIDMSKYSIPMYYKNGEGYIPMEVFNNILCPNCFAHLTYVPTDDRLYLSIESEFVMDNQIQLNKQIKAKFSTDYMKYCYNLAALTLDINFGMRSRVSRYDGNTINYKINGYENLNKHDKNKLLSTEPNVANNALMSTINEEYDDGGHTNYSNIGFIDDSNDISKDVGMELRFISGQYSALNDERITKKDVHPGLIHGAGSIGDFQIYNKEHSSVKDTAILTMDQFTITGKTDDQWVNTIELVKYADKQLRTEDGKKVKNLIIDISQNIGGKVAAECFMASYLTGGKAHSKICSLLTGAYSDVSYKADINGDSKFDENDYLPSTVENVYVITSSVTFSAGNMLANDLNDYGFGANSKKVNFIGYQSGGGACCVKTGLQTGYGSVYQTSSNLVTCVKDSDENKLTTNDAGVPINVAWGKWDPSDETQVKSFYNRDAIFDKIHQ